MIFINNLKNYCKEAHLRVISSDRKGKSSMNWLKNLKIIQKLLVLISLCVVFIGLVGFVGYYFTKKTASDMSSLYNNRLLPVVWLNDCRTHIRANETNMLALMLTKDKSKQKKYLEDLKIRADKFNKDVENYEKTKLDPYEKEQLIALKEGLAQYRTVRTALLEMIKNGQSEKAYIYFSTNKALLDDTNVHLRNIADYNQETANKVHIQAEKDANTATTIIISVIILAVLVAVSIGLLIANLIAKPVEQVVANLKEVAEGNLKVKNVDNNAKDEIGVLAQALNATVATLKGLVGAVAQSAEDISANSEEMSASSEQTAQGAQQTANSTTQLAQGTQEMANNINLSLENVNKMTHAIQQITQNANEGAKATEEAKKSSTQGSKNAKLAADKMLEIKSATGNIANDIGDLKKLSENIGEITELIKGIAGQTNLLALNAAIEAARAGEHGKGFAVVAEEVKKLAGQAGGATANITGMIKEIQAKVGQSVAATESAVVKIEEGVKIVQETGEILQQLNHVSENVNLSAVTIAKDSQILSTNADNVVKMMENISAITEETAASAEEISSITEEQTASLEEISASAQTLASVAETLTKQVSVFKI